MTDTHEGALRLEQEVAQEVAETARALAQAFSAAMAVAPKGGQGDVVPGVDQTAQQPAVEAALQHRLLAGIEANLADVVRRGRLAMERLEGVDVGAWPDLQQGIALALLRCCMRLMVLDLQLQALRAALPKLGEQVQPGGLGVSQGPQ